MTPYYDDGQAVLYHGDCREILPLLPADSVDLLLTDPPYGMRWECSGHRFQPMLGDDSTDAAVEGLRLALRCLRQHRHAYAFGRYDLGDLPLGQQAELVWDKGSHGLGNVALAWVPAHEYIQFAVHVPRDGLSPDGRNGALAARLRRGTVLHHARVRATRHPTEKPVALLRELIEMSSRFDETVLDPFAGVGSTLVAAKLEGRRGVGIEIEERFCRIAAQRLSAMTLPLDLELTDQRDEGEEA